MAVNKTTAIPVQQCFIDQNDPNYMICNLVYRNGIPTIAKNKWFRFLITKPKKRDLLLNNKSL